MLGFSVLLAVSFRIACYIGIGALGYAIFVSTTFDPHSLLMWGWFLAWPIIALIMLVVSLGAVGLTILIVVLIIMAILGYWARLAAWRRRRRNFRILRSGAKA